MVTFEHDIFLLTIAPTGTVTCIMWQVGHVLSSKVFHLSHQKHETVTERTADLNY